MSRQMSFAGLAFQEKKKTTRREQFLNEMEQVVPWSLLESLIAPYYPKAGKGRRPLPLATMTRIYCMQQWFQLSDPGLEDALYDSLAMQRFAGIALGRDAVPDETTILHFRHLLEQHGLAEQIFTATQQYLEQQGLMLRNGTIMDATIIHAPSSTKNRERARDPEMSSTKKGNQWHFGMKAHVGVDSASGLVHTVICTTASIHDGELADELLHGEEKVGYGDKAYDSAGRREAYRERDMKYRITLKAKRGRPLSAREQAWNRSRNQVRAKVEHSFGVVKHLWGYRKVRYRGIYKNACQQFALFTLANLYLVRGKLLKIQNCRA